MLLKIEGYSAFEVDVSVCNRRYVSHMVSGPVPIRAFGGPLVLMRIPGDDHVREKRESTRDGGHLLARSAPLR